MTDDLSARLELVSQLGKAGEFEEALTRVMEATLLHPDSPEAQNMLGNVRAARGEVSAAVTAYTSAIESDASFASAYHSLADINLQLSNELEAVRLYTKVLELEPNNLEALESSLNIRCQRGEYELARKLLELLVKLVPNSTAWLSQLAEMCCALGDYTSASRRYEEIIALEPKDVIPRNGLGMSLFMLGDYHQALHVYEQTEKIDPKNVSILCNIGAAKFALGDYWKAAVYFQRASDLAPNRIDLRQKLAATLREVKSFEDSSLAEAMFLRVIEHNTVIDPQLLIDPILFLLRRSPGLRELLRFSGHELPLEKTVQVCSSLRQHKLFLNLIRLCPIPDLEIEAFLRNLRRNILFHVRELTGNEIIIPLQEALGLYSHANDFVLSVTPQEKERLSNLLNESRQLLTSRRKVPVNWIACIASYLPLSSVPWIKELGEINSLKLLYKRHLYDQEAEQKIRDEIPCVESVNDAVSASVRSQYETYIYPRWVNTEVLSQPKTLSSLLTKLNVKVHLPIDHFDASLKLLVAGCGTGQHAIAASSRLKNRRTVAVDLSLSSLSYAKRQTLEFGLNNIEYINANILDLLALDENFHVIECCGVLHHMAEPWDGLASLTQILEPGGLIKLGLYSSRARAYVFAVRQEASKLGVENSIEDIRSFRDEIIHGTTYDSTLVKNLISWKDFYNTSECVDLLFHAQEHQFTLTQIEDCLAELDLMFCGFEFSSLQPVKEFTRLYPEPEQYYSLKAWDEFEIKFPNTFAGMYQFWVQKI